MINETIDPNSSLFTILAEGIQTGVLMVDQDLKIRYWNRWFAQYTGLDLDECNGRSLSDVFPLVQERGREAIYRQVIATGQARFLSPRFHPTIFKQDNGDPRYHYLRLLPILTEESSEPQGVVTVIEDLTNPIEFEKSLRESESLFRTTLFSIGDAVMIVDIDGNVKHLNLAAEQLTGWIEPDARGMPSEEIFNIINEESRQKVESPVTKVLKEGVIVGLANHTLLITKDGDEIPIADSGAPIKNDRGEVSGVVLVFRDQTEERVAQRALRESEEKFRSIYEQSPLAIQIYDKEGKLIDVNQPTLELFGVEDKNHILGFDMWADPNMSAENMAALKNGRSVFIPGNLDFEIVKKINLFPTSRSGIIYLEMYVYPLLREKEITGYLVQIIEITERVQAEEERRQIEARLRQQQKLESIGTLAGGVAHEINNPITGIMNYAQLIHERLEPEQDRLREFAAGIGHETERVAQIVRNLLAFARQEKQSHSPARINDIVDNTLTLIRTIIRRDQIALEVDVPDDLPQLNCRSQQIQQVLMNLLTNARDALNGRYPEYDPNKIMSVTVRLFEKEDRRWLRTTVEDHGTGIPDEIKERLFDPFYTTKDRTKGTGLGLSISLGIVQDHHGKLTFESEPNQNTRFYLDLPVDNG